MPSQPGDYIARNRAAWSAAASFYAEAAPGNWERSDPVWGIFGVPERDVGMLPPDVAGLDVVELGCGTAYVSAWLARRGARPVGVDLTPEQLATARRMQQRFGLPFPLVQANAERAPLASESFDLAISEYGASIWCDPHRWIPEAARLLRAGGELIFLVNGTILMLCLPDTEVELPAADRLRRDYFGMHRFDWTDSQDTEFHLGYGDWIRLLRSNGFEVTDLIEVRPPAGAATPYDYVTAEWARRWPSEEIWKARKR